MSAVDIDVIARLGRLALATRQPYLFTRVVPLLAESQPSSAEWILGYLRCLVQLGLNAAARRLVTLFPDELKRDPAIAELVRNRPAASRGIHPARTFAHGFSGGGREPDEDSSPPPLKRWATRPSGHVPWSSRQRRFDANLSALSQRHAALADEIREAWPATAERFELHQCRDGNIAVCRANSSWPPKWIPSLDDHKALASGRVNTTAVGILPPPLIFEGVGLGWEILDAYEKTRRVFLEASSTIYVVEPHIDALGILLHLHDWRTILADESVRWFGGLDAVTHLREFLEQDASWPVSDRCCVAGSLDTPASGHTNAVLREVGAARVRRADELRAEIAQRYAGRDAAHWAERFAEAADAQGCRPTRPIQVPFSGDPQGSDPLGRATHRPLRILGVTSLHTTFLQYSMRDCLAALEGLGHETRLAIEPAPHRCLDPVDTLTEQLDFEPDVVLILSRMRYEMQALVHQAIPSVTWDQDALPWVFDETRAPQLADNDFLMGYAAVNAKQRFGWPAHHLKYCTMAGTPHTYTTTPIPGLAATRKGALPCDISYVSHASATVEQETVHAESWLPEGPLRRLFRATAEQVVPRWAGGGAFPGSVLHVVVNVAEELGIPVSAVEATKVNLALLRLGDRAFRHVALQWVADWADRTGRTFHIYGNGWEKHPRLAPYARGPAANGEELRRVYRASRINLQLMGYGFLHQRALDGLMASAFFMTRRSNADAMGPELRTLLRLLDAHGVFDAAGLVSVRNDAVRRDIESRVLEVNGDPRILNRETVDSWRSTLANDFAEEVVPHFAEIAFSTCEDFESRVERFLAEPDTRDQYAAAMRTALADRYSYETRMKQMIRLLRDGFAVEAGRVAPVANRWTDESPPANRCRTPAVSPGQPH